jgi:hypothetical protein
MATVKDELVAQVSQALFDAAQSYIAPAVAPYSVLAEAAVQAVAIYVYTQLAASEGLPQ